MAEIAAKQRAADQRRTAQLQANKEGARDGTVISMDLKEPGARAPKELERRLSFQKAPLTQKEQIQKEHMAMEQRQMVISAAKVTQ